MIVMQCLRDSRVAGALIKTKIIRLAHLITLIFGAFGAKRSHSASHYVLEHKLFEIECLHQMDGDDNGRAPENGFFRKIIFFWL